MNFNSAPDRHRWLSSNSMMVAAKLATSLKPNWKIAKLGDIAERISTGTTPPSQERRYYDGDINWFTPADIGGNRWLSVAKKTITNEAISEKKARIFDSGTILITCIGHIGRVGILSETSSANQQITGIRFNKSIDPEFAYYGLFARQDELQAAAPTASTLSILNQNRLSDIDFCFPNSNEQIQISKFLSWYEDRLINQQSFTNDYPTLPDYLSDLPRIVERVEALAARIAKAQSLRGEADVETDTLFAAQSFKLFSEIKGKYETKSFGSFLPHVTSGPRYWRDRYSDNGHRFYRAQDIGSHGNILPNSKAYVTPPDSDQGKTALLEHGDLMIVITGATVGRCAVYTDDLEPGYVSQHVSICRLPQDKVLPRYALLWLLSPDGQQQLLGQRYGQGKPGLNLTNIRSIVIPVPPLDEQRRIVAYLDSVQARLASLREVQSAAGEELSALLPSVLDKAFKGEL